MYVIFAILFYVRSHCLRWSKSLLRDANTVTHFPHVRLSTSVRSTSLVMMSRKHLNNSHPRTFVMISAHCSAVEICTISMVPCSAGSGAEMYNHWQLWNTLFRDLIQKVWRDEEILVEFESTIFIIIFKNKESHNDIIKCRYIIYRNHIWRDIDTRRGDLYYIYGSADIICRLDGGIDTDTKGSPFSGLFYKTWSSLTKIIFIDGSELFSISFQIDRWVIGSYHIILVFHIYIRTNLEILWSYSEKTINLWEYCFHILGYTDDFWFGPLGYNTRQNYRTNYENRNWIKVWRPGRVL